MKRWIPLVVFAVLAGFLYVGLYLDPREVPSPYIDKPAPDFTLPIVGRPDQQFSPAQVRGKVWLLNVWAPWCTSCRMEHPTLMRLAATGVPIYGINWKDADREAAALLRQQGSPYVLSADDVDGRVGIDYGVTGTPETFVIDQAGIVRMKHVGPIDDAVWQTTFAPLIARLNTPRS